MTVTTIQKYKKLSRLQLLEKAQEVFNKWIRERDQDKPCINCSKYRTLQAGHYYPVGKFGWLRFTEDNVHGECLNCNYFNSQSHAYGYRVNLEKKIGAERFKVLEQHAKQRQLQRWDRFTLIDIIERYKK